MDFCCSRQTRLSTDSVAAVQIQHYDTIDSTNDQAKRLIQQQHSLPVLISATRQTGGRGRLGRTWQSPAGGAWFSLAYQVPENADPSSAAAIPLAAAAAIWLAISDMAMAMGDSSLERVGPSARLRIKWPNDLLIDGLKVAGILCERTVGAAGHQPQTGIIGVGINVNNDPQALGPVRLPATSLTQSLGKDDRSGYGGQGGPRGGQRGGGGGGDVSELVLVAGQRLQEQLTRLWNQGLTAEFGQWFEERMAYVGQSVTWQEQGRDCRGQCLGLNHPGADGWQPELAGGLRVHQPDHQPPFRTLMGCEVDHLAQAER